MSGAPVVFYGIFVLSFIAPMETKEFLVEIESSKTNRSLMGEDYGAANNGDFFFYFR